MKVVVIEDEHLAAKRLIELIQKYNSDIEVLTKLGSVKRSVEWFNNHPHPDLVFMDIQLGDGLSFEIFEQTLLKCPVIFTTAFDEYALRAFKVNSIDYLLKPIDFDELCNALAKFEKDFSSNKPELKFQPDKIEEILHQLTKQFKSRFVVKVGLHIRPIEVIDIQYFYSLEKATFLCTNANKNYSLDYSLDQIERLVDPHQFFRVNRKYLVHISAIQEVVAYSSSRLRIQFKQSAIQDVIVSREKVSDFKSWLE